jgi:ribulose-phosphate 3-epimerase
MKFQILPSLLAADMGHLADEAKRAEDAGADALHLDIMDGVFVPNISMGPAIVDMVRQSVKIPLSVHLMLLNPCDYITHFIDAGADSLLIHIESDGDIAGGLKRIRELGVRPGITLNPQTPASTIESCLDDVDEVLCMTVQPGYGGQAFMPEVLPKIREIRDMANARQLTELDIMVDGGVGRETAMDCVAHGANLLVAGTFLYRSSDMAAEITSMRERAQSVVA